MGEISPPRFFSVASTTISAPNSGSSGPLSLNTASSATAAIANSSMRPQTALKLSRVYDVPTIHPDTVVPTLAPRNRKMLAADTAVPAIAMGYHSFTDAKVRVMNPPKNPKRKLTANQNQ